MRLFDHDAELGLLGAALVDPRVTVRVGHVPPDAFHRPAHGLIWRAMLDLADTEWDAIAVRSRLQAIGGGAEEREALRVAEERALSAAPAHHYAETILDHWQRRKLLEAAKAITDAARSRELKGAEVPAAAEAALLQAVATTGGIARPRPMGDGLRDYIQSLETARTRGGMVGLPTGIAGIDRVTKGLRPGQVMVIAGRPGCGKSALADQIADHVGTHGHGSALVFNLEMDASQIASRPLMRRLRATEAELLEQIRSDYGAKRVTEAAAEVYRLPVFLETRDSITVTEIGAVARRHKLEHPDLSLIVVDYLGLVSSGLRRAESREREVAHVSREIKRMAKELGVPVLLLAQLNREAEKANREPRVSDLRESGSIEQDADMVLLIHHDGEPAKGPDGREVPGAGVEAELIIAKNRNGATGYLRAWFRKQWLRFDERDFREEVAEQQPKSFAERNQGRKRA